MVKIGILNLQGAVSEHFDMTRKTVENLKLDIEVEEVRYCDDVEKCDVGSVCLIFSHRMFSLP